MLPANSHAALSISPHYLYGQTFHVEGRARDPTTLELELSALTKPPEAVDTVLTCYGEGAPGSRRPDSCDSHRSYCSYYIVRKGHLAPGSPRVVLQQGFQCPQEKQEIQRRVRAVRALQVITPVRY
jgi:hypothetical protein